MIWFCKSDRQILTKISCLNYLWDIPLTIYGILKAVFETHFLKDCKSVQKLIPSLCKASYRPPKKELSI